MSKETHDIPIKLELPRYEVMAIINVLKESASRRNDLARKDGDALWALANKLFATTREQFVAFENEHKTTT